MQKILVLVLIITSLATSSIFAADCCNLTAQAPATPLEQAASGQTATGLIPPPPIYTPFGGTVVTELHFSDSDVLGIVKQVIPAVGQALRDDTNCAILKSVNPQLSALGKIDYETFVEVLNGIKDIRFMVVQYNRNLNIKQLPEQLDSAAAKAGTFSKIISDASNPYAGISAVYAQSDNGGYMGYLYQPQSRQLVAARMVGSIDYAKFIKWATETGKMFYVTVVRTSETKPQTEATTSETQPQAD